ncbi:MAG: DUF2330 domain-containing protein [Alphaproteobacteria bacterium]|nr:DUF2330 domain-containing protein [Alphaproteobacteria bacterium]MCB9695438.1 DUF2330 domain-containing protein [Alphaproteobacteria bacterium]
MFPLLGSVLALVAVAHATGGTEVAVGPRVYTSVVLVRDGDTTVISVRPADAGSVPGFGGGRRAPEVHVVPDEVFDHLERATAPWMVELEEWDPCDPHWTWEVEPVTSGTYMLSGAAMDQGCALDTSRQVRVDAHELVLPVALQGERELLVHVFARQQRYEVVGRRAVFAPTDLRVRPEVRDDVTSFYAQVFDRIALPGVVVTERAYDGVPNIPPTDLRALGVAPPHDWTVTRLHLRHGPEIRQDLVFRAMPPVAGGGRSPDPDGRMVDGGPRASDVNAFRTRYVSTRAWEGPLDCEAPHRGGWGMPIIATDPDPTSPSRPLEELLIDGFGDVVPREPETLE